MRTIFRCMMEAGYYPSFEDNYISFATKDNDIAVVEYEEGILSVRIFFSIEEDGYDMFLEASNLTMLQTPLVKTAILMDMENIMFSCEILCYTEGEFRKFFPQTVERLIEALQVHRKQMKKLIKATETAAAKIPATEDSMAGTHKLLS